MLRLHCLNNRLCPSRQWSAWKPIDKLHNAQTRLYVYVILGYYALRRKRYLRMIFLSRGFPWNSKFLRRGYSVDLLLLR